MLNDLSDLPLIEIPNNYITGNFGQAIAARSHQLSFITFCQTRNLMRVTIKLIHFWPESMLYQIVIMRRKIEVNFIIFNILRSLLNIYLLFFFVIIIRSYFLPFYFLNLCHQPQHLSASFCISLIEKGIIFWFTYSIL